MTVIVLYVAATEASASREADELERSASTIVAVPTVSLETIRERAPAADCVVFAETPTTVDGAHLLDVIDACGETPLVLFTDAAYAPTTARATEGIDGYVRRDGDRSAAHLADEINWVCHEPPSADEPKALPSAPVDEEDGSDATDATDAAASDDDWLSTLLEAVPDPAVRFAIGDGETIVRDVNAAFETVFDEDAAALRGTRLADHHALDVVEAEEWTPDDRRGSDDPPHVFTRCRTPEGQRDFLVTGVACDRDGRGIGVATFRDVTDRKRRERALSAQRERLKEFERIVNHELRNRLNLAQGYLAAARETNDPGHVAEVETAHDRLAEAIDALLELSRRRDVIATVEPVALHDVARRAWARLDEDGDARTLHLADDRLLEADKERLTDILEHLFRSAGPTVEGPVTIRVGASATGFFVADDGAPLPESDRERLLERGADGADRRGYGFEIVTRIAEAHGWSVSIDESATGGTRVEFDDVGTDEDWLFGDSIRVPAFDRVETFDP